MIVASQVCVAIVESELHEKGFYSGKSSQPGFRSELQWPSSER
jgi:hypothetical protein